MTDEPWLKSSIMSKRGVAMGEAGRRHELSIEAQGSFHYVYGPYAKPVLTIDPGDIVVVETEDAFGGVITSEKDSPSAKLKFPFLNPQCGPIAVTGIEKGDCLAVHIQAVETRGAQPAGKTCIIPEFGGLVGTANTAMLNPPLPERVRVMHVDKDGVRWMAAEHGFDEIDAYMLLSQAGRIRLGNMVDPKYTVGASILKTYLV